MNFEQVVKDCHWITKIDDYHYEMILDHHMLSTFRSCEQLFVHTMIEGWKPKSEIYRMPWFFAFGIVLHDAMEYLYASKEADNYDQMRFTSWLKDQWIVVRQMEIYNNPAYPNELKSYNNLGGLVGFVTLMIQYVEFYNQDRERLRPIATEISFGKGKEVPLGSFYFPYPDPFNFAADQEIQIDCFLAGRIDFLMDNGRIIGPMDHKSSAFIDGDPLGKYDPQEGMTGYIYTSKKIIEKHFPELSLKRDTNVMWMNFIASQQNTDPNKRFKRLPLRKTDWQLEQFRLRQLGTFEKIFQIIYNNREPDWNTSVCSNMFRRDCMFKKVHRQSDPNSMFLILDSDFQRMPIWNSDMSHEVKEEKK